MIEFFEVKSPVIDFPVLCINPLSFGMSLRASRFPPPTAGDPSWTFREIKDQSDLDAVLGKLRSSSSGRGCLHCGAMNVKAEWHSSRKPKPPMMCHSCAFAEVSEGHTCSKSWEEDNLMGVMTWRLASQEEVVEREGLEPSKE